MVESKASEFLIRSCGLRMNQYTVFDAFEGDMSLCDVNWGDASIKWLELDSTDTPTFIQSIRAWLIDNVSSLHQNDYVMTNQCLSAVVQENFVDFEQSIGAVIVFDMNLYELKVIAFRRSEQNWLSDLVTAARGRKGKKKVWRCGSVS